MTCPRSHRSLAEQRLKFRQSGSGGHCAVLPVDAAREGGISYAGGNWRQYSEWRQCLTGLCSACRSWIAQMPEDLAICRAGIAGGPGTEQL